MKIGLVVEYLHIDGQIKYSEEVQESIQWFRENHEESYVINPLNSNVTGGKVQALNLASGELEYVPLDEFKTIYFGFLGQKFYECGVSNALAENAPQVCALFEGLKPFEKTVSFVNPLDAMIWNMSKQYLIDLSEEGIPFIPTQEVNSLDQLVHLSRSEKVLIAKPKIAERANGTHILRDMNESQVRDYFEEYTSLGDIDGLYGEVRNRQGLIVQEFQDGFIKYGEKKIFLIGGEITLARITLPRDVEGLQLVSWSNGASVERYSPTKKEADVCLEVWDFLRKMFPISYIRVDLVGDGNEVLINELELINPCSASSKMDSLYTEEEFNDHHRRLLLSLKNK